MHDPSWLASQWSHTQYGGVQNDPPKIRIGVQVLNSNFAYSLRLIIFTLKQNLKILR